MSSNKLSSEIFFCQNVICRKVGDDFLAYSAFTGDTVILTYFSFCTLNYLLAEKLSFSQLLKKLFDEEKDTDNLSVTLTHTINELIKRGFIFQSLA